MSKWAFQALRNEKEEHKITLKMFPFYYVMQMQIKSTTLKEEYSSFFFYLTRNKISKHACDSI